MLVLRLCYQYTSHSIWGLFKDNIFLLCYQIRLATVLNKPENITEVKLGVWVCVCVSLFLCVLESRLYVFPADFTTCSRQCQPDSFISQQDSVQTHAHKHTRKLMNTNTHPHAGTHTIITNYFPTAWIDWLAVFYSLTVPSNQTITVSNCLV